MCNATPTRPFPYWNQGNTSTPTVALRNSLRITFLRHVTRNSFTFTFLRKNTRGVGSNLPNSAAHHDSCRSIRRPHSPHRIQKSRSYRMNLSSWHTRNLICRHNRTLVLIVVSSRSHKFPMAPNPPPRLPLSSLHPGQVHKLPADSRPARRARWHALRGRPGKRNLHARSQARRFALLPHFVPDHPEQSRRHPDRLLPPRRTPRSPSVPDASKAVANSA